MSAIVCGKRSFLEDLPTSPPAVKRIRCSSSPVRYSPSRHVSSRPSALHQLASFFPDMDNQLLERALEECGDDLDSAIKSLNELHLGCAQESVNLDAGKCDAIPVVNVQLPSQSIMITNGEASTAEDASAPKNLAMDGGEWVELFVKEMMSSSNIDDARARASRALEALEKSVIARAGAEVVQHFQQENTMLKGQVEALNQENTLLKRAVSIQHERQKEYEDKSQELQRLKLLVSQYQEQLRTLEVNNYALTMHLKQAQQSNSIPGRFHPDVF